MLLHYVLMYTHVPHILRKEQLLIARCTVTPTHDESDCAPTRYCCSTQAACFASLNYVYTKQKAVCVHRHRGLLYETNRDLTTSLYYCTAVPRPATPPSTVSFIHPARDITDTATIGEHTTLRHDNNQGTGRGSASVREHGAICVKISTAQQVVCKRFREFEWSPVTFARRYTAPVQPQVSTFACPPGRFQLDIMMYV